MKLLKSVYMRSFFSLIIAGIFALGLVVVPLSSLVPTAAAAPAPWVDDWLYHEVLSINHNKVVGGQSSFPVLVDVTDAGLVGNTQPDGGDIVFADSEGTKLSHEIESYDSGSGHLIAWVNVPSLSSSVDTRLDMHYGNAAVGNQWDPNGVWDQDFMMVQHLEEASGAYNDSTVNGNNGTVFGGITRNVAGVIDGAAGFNGAGGNYVQVPSSPSIGGVFSTGFTASFWMKPGDVSRRQSILQKYNTVGSQRNWMIEYRTDVGRALAFLASSNGISYDWWYAGFNPVVGNWYHVVVVWQTGAVPKFYVNGQQVSTVRTGTLSQISGSSVPLDIGRSTYQSGREFNGVLDEVSVSDVARSAGWISTYYNNQLNPSSFITIVNEDGTSISAENPSDGASGISPNPILSVRANGNRLNITFTTNASGTWQTIGGYTNVASGTYSLLAWNTTNMKQLNTMYYWGVEATDGTNWVNKTYRFTTATTILSQKWVATGLLPTRSGVLAADIIGNDGIEEVIHAGGVEGDNPSKVGQVTVLRGTDGSVVWQRSVVGVGDWVKPQMADLNRDGILEIIVPLELSGIEVLNSRDGTTVWRVANLGGHTFSSPVVADVDGDGYPTIFIGSEDVNQGLNGLGRISALSYDGRILRQVFTWRTCAGGLSAADGDGDGRFEIYAGDRDMYMGDGDWGRGARSFWADDLTERWNAFDVLSSSQAPPLADVNKDGVLDVIVSDQRGGMFILDSRTGSAIREGRNLGLPSHYQMSVYDIDGDGNLELLMADGDHPSTAGSDVVIFDAVTWRVDGRLYVGESRYGPQEGDVTGDGIMDIIASSFNNTKDPSRAHMGGIHIIDGKAYSILDEVVGGGLSGLNYAVMQDIDGDSFNEIIVSNDNGRVYAYDTPGLRPTPRPRSEVQFYSERRNGAAEFVLPLSVAPIVSDPSPAKGAINVPVSLSQLSFNLADGQGDSMIYSVTTSPNIGSGSGNGRNGRYSIPVGSLTASTTYTWHVNVTDGAHWTNTTYSFTTAKASSLTWWNGDWQYRRSIIIDHTKVLGSQNGFPVLVDVTESGLVGKTQPDGGDIVFTDIGNNKLDHEIESYDSGSGHLVAWVNVPILSSTTDTKLYIYYGNAGAGDQWNPNGVWDQDFMMVQHLEETSGASTDSTVNGNNGTPLGGVTQNAVGKINGADSFDGVNDYVSVPSSASISGFSGGFTASFWTRLGDVTKRQSILQKYNSAGNQRGWMIEYRTDVGRALAFLASSNGISYDWWYAAFNPTAGNWYYIVLTWQANTAPKFFVDGQQISTVRAGTISQIFDSTGAPLELGRSIYQSGRELNGFLDEVCVSDVAQSAGWVATSYNNQQSPSSFCTIESEEQYSGGANQPPTQENPLLESTGLGDLICTNQSTFDPDGDKVTNIYNWYRSSWYEENVSMTNLLLPFDTENLEVAKDYSGGSNNGEVYGASWTKNGKVGGAYVFDGSPSKASYILVPDHSSLDGGGLWTEMTLEAWFYLTQDQSATRIVAKLPSYEIGFQEGGAPNRLFAGVWTTSSSRINYGAPLSNNTWYHVALSYKNYFYPNGSGLMSLYLNGDLVGSRLKSGSIKDSIEPLFIGWFDFFKGMIDDVRLYPTWLTAQQIRQHYLETRDGSSSSSTLVGEGIRGGYTYRCAVTPTDGIQDGVSKFSNELYVPNNPPEASDLVMLPRGQTWAVDGDDLICNYLYTDVDGQPESGTQIRWYRNSILQPSLNDLQTVPAGNTIVGDQWYFTVRPRDGIDFGNLVTSYTVTILQNSAPTQGQPQLVSSGGPPDRVNENLTCTPQNTDDGDGDPVRNIYHWYVNGTSMTNLLLPFDTVDAATAKDYSGYGNDGSVRGATWTSDGIVGGAYVFDGTDGIIVPDDNSLGGVGRWTEISIEFWIKVSSLQRGARIIAKKAGTASNGAYMIGFQTSNSYSPNTLFFDVLINGTSSQEIVASTALAVNAWYHVVCTYKLGQGLAMYVNGRLGVSSAPVTGYVGYPTSPLGEEPLFIGYDGGLDSVRYIIGTVDEISIHSRAFTPAQVQQRYSESRNGQSSSSTIVFTETRVGDVWMCQVTPNDKYEDGIPKTSNVVTILP